MPPRRRHSLPLIRRHGASYAVHAAEPDASGNASRLDCSHMIIAGVVLDLRQAKCFEYGRHVGREPSSQTFLEAIPAADGIIGCAPPCFDGSFGCLFLLVGVAQRHPVPVVDQHGVEILDAREMVPELGLAHRDHQGRRVCLGISICLERAASRWSGQLPWVGWSASAYDIIVYHGGILSGLMRHQLSYSLVDYLHACWTCA
jgi:hypothetical protein